MMGTLNGKLVRCGFHGTECDGNIYQPHRFGIVPCGYSAAHTAKGVPATQIIDCGPIVGEIGACDPCADFYERMS
jgi:hypothetical protein